jgi:hypothetical protein
MRCDIFRRRTAVRALAGQPTRDACLTAVAWEVASDKAIKDACFHRYER